ncbi:hypothetical protein GCM10007049_10400 [Echinicola pacifica]|uniref:Methyltransferase domain-containing protein n=1 Tax=Echinicola pacifica TaxID=346377 RepID=A0A918ULW4_9BACT|nr:methyltransferase domain-containing protein [Echinicola pacifica]GGZ19777.1 hypothetical protein GCM10007049_10400 [Echinicola pacifica]
MNIPDKETIFSELRNEVLRNGSKGEVEYFNYHEKRFNRVVDFIARHYAGRKLRILDIGSHYLHTACLMRKMGHEVDGMDVPVFWGMPTVAARADTYGIGRIIEADLAIAEALQVEEGHYDVVLFTEIMEHITFNPVAFWKKVHHATSDGGRIYISTPNSLSLPGLVRSTKNILTFKGVGTSVTEIMAKGTYGHHWKEYSSREIKTYFELLSDDFSVEVQKYSYKTYKGEGQSLYSTLAHIGNATGFLAEELEAVVTLHKGHPWKAINPQF